MYDLSPFLKPVSWIDSCKLKKKEEKYEAYLPRYSLRAPSLKAYNLLGFIVRSNQVRLNQIILYISTIYVHTHKPYIDIYISTPIPIHPPHSQTIPPPSSLIPHPQAHQLAPIQIYPPPHLTQPLLHTLPPLLTSPQVSKN